MKSATTFFAACLLFGATAHAIDFFANDMTASTGWSNASSNGTYNFTTLDSQSVVVLAVPTASTGRYGGIANTTTINGVGVAGRVLHLGLTANTTAGTSANGDFFQAQLRKNTGSITVRLASDGLYVMNNTGSYVNTGVSVPNATWTTWDVWSNQTGDSTATCNIYKNNVVSATGVACGGGTTAYTAGQMYLQQYGNTTSGVSTVIDTVTATGYGLRAESNCENLSLWAQSGTNTTAGSIITQVSVDGYSAFNFTCVNGTASPSTILYTGSNRNSKRFVVEMRAKFTSLGPCSMTNRQYFHLGFEPSALTSGSVLFNSDGVYLGNSCVTRTGPADIVDFDAWHVWSFEFDLAKKKCNIKKDGVYIGSNNSLAVVAGAVNGRLYLQIRGRGLTTNAYIDWVRVTGEDSFVTYLTEG